MAKDSSNFVSAGYISGAHGIRGEIILVAKINDFDLIEDCLESNFFFQKDEVIKSIKADKFRVHKNNILLSSSQIPDRNIAEEFKGWTWVIPKEKFVSKSDENIFLEEIKGFLIVDSRLGEIGNIVKFSTNGAQDLIEVIYKDKEVSIPLVKPFIVKIDFPNKKIFMNLPEGLVDEV